ncbi:hypothetical protein AA0113_g683 [Alternaria arborescens]|uniref:Uncharacterized protein n=1 Tax=Alternaria arborescens TaxID=156630 RepID=A0A4Q4SPJ3_9PLEO|nr:hypothetical protein AA0111_g10135 [Alternaria arborescens]RYN29960.1 hypothetical protein AA0112_g7058 [Alternaria arborescens]RYO20480.1 hypothetical protein AA0111_g10135 [Alternaria arborescens]RYO72814.1 hypothetical protein AA0113_g683 [Alternaria arborescens]
MGGLRTFILAIASLVSSQLILSLSKLICASYNSAVFGSISSNDYMVFSVDEAFVNDKTCTNCFNEVKQEKSTMARFTDGTLRSTESLYGSGEVIGSTLESLWSKARSGKLDRLEPATCIDEYATSIQSNRKNLLIVSGGNGGNEPRSQYNFINGSYVYWADQFDVCAAADLEFSRAFQWICSGSDDPNTECSSVVDRMRNQPSWQVGWRCDGNGVCDFLRSPVKYCLSESAQPHCKLHFEPTIATIITVLNLGKFRSCSTP